MMRVAAALAEAIACAPTRIETMIDDLIAGHGADGVLTSARAGGAAAAYRAGSGRGRCDGSPGTGDGGVFRAEIARGLALAGLGT